MDKKKLEEYKSKKAEIKELQYKLSHLGAGDSLIGNNVIMDYRKGYPIPQSVVGYDFEKEKRLRESYEKRLQKLRQGCIEVEMWVEDIPDSLTRRIFGMCYQDEMTQEKVAKAVHISQAAVSKKISEFLKME